MNVPAPISQSRAPSFQRAVRKIAKPTGIAIISMPFIRWARKRISIYAISDLDFTDRINLNSEIGG
jgi:hypothetical protein